MAGPEWDLQGRVALITGVADFSFIDTEMVRDAREHPAVRDAGRSPADRPAALGDAGEAILSGVRRRSRWVVVPRWVAPVLVARGALQPLADLAQRRSHRLREVVRRANEEARR